MRSISQCCDVYVSSLLGTPFVVRGVDFARILPHCLGLYHLHTIAIHVAYINASVIGRHIYLTFVQDIAWHLRLRWSILYRVAGSPVKSSHWRKLLPGELMYTVPRLPPSLYGYGQFVKANMVSCAEYCLHGGEVSTYDKPVSNGKQPIASSVPWMFACIGRFMSGTQCTDLWT